MSSLRRDEGGIVVGWLLKLVVVTTLVAIVAFDAGSVGVARLNAADDANSAASAAAQVWQQTHNLSSANDAAVSALTNPKETLVPRSLRIDPDGTVHLEIRREARTLVMYRVGPLKRYTFTIAKGESGPPTS
jgi:hypothetical protein